MTCELPPDSRAITQEANPPPPEPVQTEQPAWMRSDAVIPGSVPGETLLVRTGEVAVAIGSVRGYPNGFEFTLHTRLRAEDEDGEGPDPFEWHGRRGPRSPGDHLRLGVMYADGRRAATTGGSWPDDNADEGELILLMEGSGEATGDGTAISGSIRCRRTAR